MYVNQKHRGKPLLFHDKCSGFFYVHYFNNLVHGPCSLTSHPKDRPIIWLSVLLRDTSATIGQAGILTPPGLESNALDRSATTLHYMYVWKEIKW